MEFAEDDRGWKSRCGRMHFKDSGSFSRQYFKLIILKFNRILMFGNKIKRND